MHGIVYLIYWLDPHEVGTSIEHVIAPNSKFEVATGALTLGTENQ